MDIHEAIAEARENITANYSTEPLKALLAEVDVLRKANTAATAIISQQADEMARISVEPDRVTAYAQDVVQTCQKEANDLKASNQRYIAENAQLKAAFGQILKVAHREDYYISSAASQMQTRNCPRIRWEILRSRGISESRHFERTLYEPQHRHAFNWPSYRRVHRLDRGLGRARMEERSGRVRSPDGLFRDVRWHGGGPRTRRFNLRLLRRQADAMTTHKYGRYMSNLCWLVLGLMIGEALKDCSAARSRSTSASSAGITTPHT